MSAFDLDALTLGDVTVTGRGAKQVGICGPNSQIAAWTLDAMSVAYEPSAYQDPQATRVNIVFRPTPEILSFMDALDNWVLEQVASNSERIVGKPRSDAQLRDMYQPIVKRSEKFPPQIKSQVNLEAPSALRCWDLEKNPRAAPSLWRDAVVKPRLWLRSLYLMNGCFGVTLECTDCQIVSEGSSQCPF
jgi:hypothetical protein